MSGALDGILVVALEQAVAAPVATARLADAGARVIKLERPEGDFSRSYDDSVFGQSTYFIWINRGKESCRVDLKTPQDLALVERMLARADIFVQNLAPGATGRLGLGSAELRARHPRLIVCDISGYTAGSPMYERKAYDLLIQAETGLAFVTGSEGSGANRVGISICDISTGHAAYEAILEALILRARTSKGSHIQLSLFDTMADFMNVPYLTRRYGGREPRRLGLAHPSIAPYGVFHFADGDIVIAVQSDGEWKILCTKVLEDEALAHDSRFDTNVKRTRNRDDLDTLLQARFSAQTMDEVTARLDLARIAYGRISTVSDLMRHPSASIVPVQTPEGTAELLAPPAIVDGKRAKLGRVPRLGEHDEALRVEFAHE